MSKISGSTISIAPRSKSRGRKFIVEINRERFEKLISNLGLFNPEFLRSLERAEQQITKGKTKRLRSLRDLTRLSHSF